MGRNGTVLVTGANGFIGQHLCKALFENGWDVRLAVRNIAAAQPIVSMGGDVTTVGEIGPGTDWTSALSEVQYVVHLAARVHVMDGRRDEEDPYRVINAEGTAQLARSAAAAGVRRLVYISSIKVNGDGTSADRPYRESDWPAPQDFYGASKWRAEQELAIVADSSPLEVVVLRPPLVYGAGARANFRDLVQAVALGAPLPLGAVHNARSLLFVGNLVDAIMLCLRHPAAAGNTYMVSDGEDVSTPQLVRRIGAAMNRPVRLMSVPLAFLRVAAALGGRRAAVKRLCGSLIVDATKIRRELGWRPPFSLDEGLRRTVVP